jgi:hypothetical protein
MILEIQFQNKNIGEELGMNNITRMKLHVTHINSGNIENFEEKLYSKESFMGLLKERQNDRMIKKSF